MNHPSRNLKISLITLLFVSLALIFVPSQSIHAATITVSGDCTLIDAINAANTDAPVGGCPAGAPGADTIVLTGDVTLTAIDNTVDGANGLPSITSIMTIEGGGFTIQRDPTFPVCDYTPSAQEFRILHVGAGGDLTLNEATIVNGCANVVTHDERSGGGILNHLGTLTVTNSTFTGNAATFEGGAIRNIRAGSTLIIVDSVFTDNRAEWTDPVVPENTYGGAIGNLNADVTISGSTISNNIATSSFPPNYGGGLYSIGTGTVIISDTTISGNQSAGDGSRGGGISNDLTTGEGTLSVLDSTISNNIATFRGGGISNTMATLIVDNSIILDNTATHGSGISNFRPSGEAVSIVTVANSTLSGNRPSGEGWYLGGGIYNERGDINLDNSELVNNGNNQVDQGGGIYNFDGNITIDNSTISGNQATEANRRGGGIYNELGTVNIANSTLSDNSAPWGGGVYNLLGGVTIDNSTVSGNMALGDPAPGFRGGGVYNDGGTVDVNDSTLSGNMALDAVNGSGGGIYNTSDNGPSTVAVTGSTLSNNAATRYGGGIYNGQPANTAIVDLTNSTLSGNSATNLSGGGIYNDGGATNIVHSTLSGNSATNGGGIGLNGGTVSVTSSIVANSPSGGECNIIAGTFTPVGQNIANDGTCTGFTMPNTDPNIGELADNGGATQTHELQTDSPAINGTAAACSGDPVNGVDQRGETRNDGNCDIGAHEADTAR